MGGEEGHQEVDPLGFEPRAFRMRSGCDTTAPCAHLPLKDYACDVFSFRFDAFAPCATGRRCEHAVRSHRPVRAWAVALASASHTPKQHSHETNEGIPDPSCCQPWAIATVALRT